MLAMNSGLTVAGSIVGLLYLIFIIYCAVDTLRKGHILLFILGFFCGFAWIIGLLTPDRRIRDDRHYVPPPPS